ncbi:MAG: MoaD/ThiS family protein [Planctomycetia bacterium]|nr:MoaD/ThiS family protein [Planctomycetia bacterium]
MVDPSPEPPSTPPVGRLRIALFAGMAAAADRRSIDIPWDGGTAAMLRERLARELPAVAALAARSAVAGGDAYLSDDAFIAPGAEVAVIPPVSGG